MCPRLSKAIRVGVSSSRENGQVLLTAAIKRSPIVKHFSCSATHMLCKKSGPPEGGSLLILICQAYLVHYAFTYAVVSLQRMQQGIYQCC